VASSAHVSKVNAHVRGIHSYTHLDDLGKDSPCLLSDRR